MGLRLRQEGFEFHSWIFSFLRADFCPCCGGWWQLGQVKMLMESEEESRKSWEKGGKKGRVCLPSEDGRIWPWSNCKRISEGIKSNILQPVGQLFFGFSFSPEPVSLQDLDWCQMEPTDHNGLTHPGFQSSGQIPAPSVYQGKLRICSQEAWIQFLVLVLIALFLLCVFCSLYYYSYFIFYFVLENTCITMLYWFLPCSSMNHP